MIRKLLTRLLGEHLALRLGFYNPPGAEPNNLIVHSLIHGIDGQKEKRDAAAPVNPPVLNGTLEEYSSDEAIAGEDIEPGQTVYMDQQTGKWFIYVNGNPIPDDCRVYWGDGVKCGEQFTFRHYRLI